MILELKIWMQSVVLMLIVSLCKHLRILLMSCSIEYIIEYLYKSVLWISVSTF